MNNFYQHLKRQMNKYPKACVQDILKLIYQSEFAGGHLIKSKETAYEYLLKEISNIDNPSKLLYEYISENIVRVNLDNKLDSNQLIDLFIKSSNLLYDGANLIVKIDCYLNLLEELKININNLDEIKAFSKKPTIFSHTNQYKENYDPHYRVINTEFLPLEYRITKLQNFIDQLPTDKLTLISVEGKCASGKTTICNKLTGVTIIHADDFFSKIDVLDFKKLESIINNLEIGKSISYVAYDCQNDSFYEKELINISPVVIIEGVFSYKEPLKKYYDKLVFFETTKELQKIRLLKKTNNKTIIDNYLKKWIPREDKYFDEHNYILDADIII